MFGLAANARDRDTVGIGPYEVLEKLPGARVVFAGAEKRVYESDTPTLGIAAEASFAEIDAADIVLVGGTAHLAQVTANPPLITPGARAWSCALRS